MIRSSSSFFFMQEPPHNTSILELMQTSTDITSAGQMKHEKHQHQPHPYLSQEGSHHPSGPVSISSWIQQKDRIFSRRKNSAGLMGVRYYSKGYSRSYNIQNSPRATQRLTGEIASTSSGVDGDGAVQLFYHSTGNSNLELPLIDHLQQQINCTPQKQRSSHQIVNNLQYPSPFKVRTTSCSSRNSFRGGGSDTSSVLGTGMSEMFWDNEISADEHSSTAEYDPEETIMMLMRVNNHQPVKDGPELEWDDYDASFQNIEDDVINDYNPTLDVPAPDGRATELIIREIDQLTQRALDENH